MTSPAAGHKSPDFDPEHYRMTVGEHLEELRTRLIRGLLGFVLALVFCFIVGRDYIIPIFCRPLVQALAKSNLNPQLYYKEAAEPFVVYMEISMISAAVIASPWLLYQLWQFVAAGLYPRERKVITKYLPLSIALLIAGVITLYFLVLPVSLEFFFHFGSSLPLEFSSPPIDVKTATTQPVVLPMVRGTPPGQLLEGQAWVDIDRRRVGLFFNGQVHAINLAPQSLVAPIITLPEYINMVVNMLLAFGISFQLPLVVKALVRAGIVEIEFLRSMRKYVYFIISIVAAVIIPDVVTGWFLLMLPLFALYEFGIWLASRNPNVEE